MNNSDLDKFYRYNSFFSNTLSIIVISFIWTISLLTIVPFGPATSAMYYTMVHAISRSEGDAIKVFFSRFCNDFKRNTFIGIIYLLLVFLLLFGIVFCGQIQDDSKIWKILNGVYLVLLVLEGIITPFLFSVYSHVELKGFTAAKVGIMLGIKHLFASVTCFLLLLIVFWIISKIFSLIIILPALTCLLISMVLEKYYFDEVS